MPPMPAEDTLVKAGGRWRRKFTFLKSDTCRVPSRSPCSSSDQKGNRRGSRWTDTSSLQHFLNTSLLTDSSRLKVLCWLSSACIGSRPLPHTRCPLRPVPTFSSSPAPHAVPVHTLVTTTHMPGTAHPSSPPERWVLHTFVDSQET